MVVPPTALNSFRRELRKRRQVIAIECKDASLHASSTLGRLLTNTKSVALYRPMNGEPDPLPLLNNFAAATALPALFVNNPLITFRLWSRGDPLVTSPWGGQQPCQEATAIIPDLIFVPMLGFDAAFNRIGQGGGHYDRYLAAHPRACRIGIAWEAQRVDNTEPRPWDVQMDAILTETGFHVKDLTRCQRP